MASVSGRCVDASGTPVPGAYIYAVPATGARFGKALDAHSRRDGRWRLTLGPGEWTIRETGHGSYDVTVNGTAPIDLVVPPAQPAGFTGEPSLELDDPTARLTARRGGDSGVRDLRREWGPSPEVATRRRERAQQESTGAEPDVAAAAQDAVERLMTRRRKV